jgi:RND family efflux transporter MFP subunit
MKSWLKWVLVSLVIAAAAGGGYWLGHHGGAGGADKDDETTAAGKTDEKPVATVGVVSIKRAEISEPITAYGTVVAPASEVRVLSVPFESRVTKVFVTPGQTVAAGEPLVEVEASAATQLAVEEARNAVSAAERDLQLVKQRYDQKLATNSDLFTAQNALKSAQARLNSLQQGGAGGPRKLSAGSTGIVSKVDVQVGQVIAIGNPLVEVAAQNRIEVKLSAEPQDTSFLKPGQTVQLRPVDQPNAEPVTGKIRLVGQRVDPTARLVDVMVALPADTKLLLDGLVTGQMSKVSAEGLVVPRDAVLPDDDGYTLFTVKDNHAVKHKVQIAVENNQEVEVTGNDLHEGDLAVVQGNYELEDGMIVQAQPAATKPAASEPAATEPAKTESAIPVGQVFLPAMQSMYEGISAPRVDSFGSARRGRVRPRTRRPEAGKNARPTVHISTICPTMLVQIASETGGSR